MSKLRKTVVIFPDSEARTLRMTERMADELVRRGHPGIQVMQLRRGRGSKR
jgi:hypothetical protein